MQGSGCIGHSLVILYEAQYVCTLPQCYWFLDHNSLFLLLKSSFYADFHGQFQLIWFIQIKYKFILKDKLNYMQISI